MTRILFFIALATLCAVAGGREVYAQGRPDFSGTWRVEQVTVEGPEREGGARGMGGRGGQFGGRFGRGREGDGDKQGRGAGPARMNDTILEQGDRVTVKQTETALIVTDEKRSTMRLYPFDGREATNYGDRDAPVKSRTKWDGVALVTETSRSVPGRGGRGGEMTITTREVKSLSEDGQTMTWTSRANTPFGQLTSTTTFVKIDDAR